MERVHYSRNELAAQQLLEHYGRTPVAHVRSFGCQQSVNDGERLKGVLQDVGYALADGPENADVVLYNTCAVREHAEQRAFGNIGALKKIKEKNPKLIIGLCGCMSQEQTVVDKVRQSYPYVDLVLGVNIADQLPDILLQRLGGAKRIIHEPGVRQEIVEDIPTRREHGFKAFLPIMYGCDNFCTYCIVPYVRGRERSRAAADIKKEFEVLVAEGYKEITLLGQNVNSWGKGLDGGMDFPGLLEYLAETPGEYKLRFMTSHPKDATRRLIDVMAANDHLCKHLHLPVQSGSNSMLKAMNRGYTAAEYLELIAYAKQACPQMTFSSDIMLGFPGETEQDFEDTLALVQKVGYTQLFTFIYSKRSGTKAADMPDSTPRKEKTDRMGRLLKTQEECVAKAAETWLGKTFTALVEGPGRRKGCTAARLDNNMLLEYEGEGTPGEFVTVLAEELKGAVLLGRRVVK